MLTSEQITHYHEWGYLVLEQFVDADEVVWMREIYDRLFRERAGREFGDQFDLAGPDEEGVEAALPQILNPAKYAPELKQGRYRDKALEFAKELLGPGAVYQGEHAIFKPARTGAQTPWHQDEAYWAEDKEFNAFSLWIPLQGATVDNGCMWFVPGSHRLEVQPHHCINNDVLIHGLEIDEIDTSPAVACPLPPGGCTIHHNRTLHYTGPNRSDVPRRAYILGYGLPPKPRTEPRVFYWNRMKHPPREDRVAAASAGSAG